MTKYKEWNKNYRYLLFCIDIFSKRLYVELQLSKNVNDTTKCLEKIIKKMDFKPKFLMADRGSEFYNRSTKAMLKKYDIHLYSSFNYDVKAAICER